MKRILSLFLCIGFCVFLAGTLMGADGPNAVKRTVEGGELAWHKFVTFAIPVFVIFCIILIGVFLSPAPRSKEKQLEKRFVHEAMTKEFLSIEDRQTLFEAQNMIKKNKINNILVVSGFNELCGVITTKDFEGLEPEKLMRMTVKNIPVREIAMIYPHDNLQKAVSLMEDRVLDSLPVVNEDRRVVGMITRAGIDKLLATS